MQNQENLNYNSIKLIFYAFTCSVIILIGISYLICSEPQSNQNLFDPIINQVLFIVGLIQLGVAQFAWQNLYNKESQLFKKLIASAPDERSRFRKLFVFTIIVLAFTESSAVMGFVISLGSICKDTSGLILMLGALATYIIRFPKVNKVQELLRD